MWPKNKKEPSRPTVCWYIGHALFGFHLPCLWWKLALRVKLSIPTSTIFINNITIFINYITIFINNTTIVINNITIFINNMIFFVDNIIIKSLSKNALMFVGDSIQQKYIMFFEVSETVQINRVGPTPSPPSPPGCLSSWERPENTNGRVQRETASKNISQHNDSHEEKVKNIKVLGELLEMQHLKREESFEERKRVRGDFSG